MHFNKSVIQAIGAPVLLSLVATPLLAATQSHETSYTIHRSELSIELIYPRLAQVGGNEIDGGDRGRDDSRDSDDGDDRAIVSPVGPEVLVSDDLTFFIVRRLEDAERICEFMGDEYRISCFAVVYRQLAEELPGNGDYEDAKEVLLDTANELDRVVQRNLDRNKPALRARTTGANGQTVQTPPMRAVRADRAVQLNNEASNVLAEAETVLLRSASSDAARAIHYQRIAAAVGSNKVLLRSS